MVLTRDFDQCVVAALVLTGPWIEARPVSRSKESLPWLEKPLVSMGRAERLTALGNGMRWPSGLRVVTRLPPSGGSDGARDPEGSCLGTSS